MRGMQRRVGNPVGETTQAEPSPGVASERPLNAVVDTTRTVGGHDEVEVERVDRSRRTLVKLALGVSDLSCAPGLGRDRVAW